MQPLTKLLMAAALLLAVVGLALALGRPGDLGDDAETAQPGVTEPDADPDERDPDGSTTTTTAEEGDADASTTTAPDTTTTAAPAGDGNTPPTIPSGEDGAEGSTSTTTTVAGSTVDPPPGGSSGGSGLDGSGAGPRDLEDGLAATGGTSLLGGALAVALLGLALPRRRA